MKRSTDDSDDEPLKSRQIKVEKNMKFNALIHKRIIYIIIYRYN